MKAISLWEPWASLIAVGAKKFETRSWATKYRGPLLICAAKKKVLKEFEYLLTLVGPYPPLGKAVALVELVDCIRTENLSQEQIGEERWYGDFSPGRYAWKLENVRAFKEPFPVKGKQGLFEVDDHFVMQKMVQEKAI